MTDSAQPPARRPWTEQDYLECSTIVTERRKALTTYVRRRFPGVDHDNVVGDALLALYQQWDRIEGDKLAWLYRVARNKALDAVKHKEAGHGEIDELAGAVDKAAPIGVWTPPSPGEKLLFIEAVIVGLPRSLGLPLTLLEKGWRVEDIAEYMGLSLATTRTYLSRAKSRLNHVLNSASEYPQPAHRSPRRDR